jgi:HEAT repeat protein
MNESKKQHPAAPAPTAARKGTRLEVLAQELERPGAFPKFNETIKNSEDAACVAALLAEGKETARIGAIWALEGAAIRKVALKEQVPDLAKAVSDKSILVRLHAIRTLGLMRKNGENIFMSMSALTQARKQYAHGSFMLVEIDRCLSPGLGGDGGSPD